MSKVKNRNLILTIAALIVLVLILSIAEDAFGSYVTRIMKVSAIYAICALSMNMVNGFTGMFSLGQPGFMAIGAYVTALLLLRPETKDTIFYLEPMVSFLRNLNIPSPAAAPWLPLLIGLLVGGIIAAIAAFLIGFPVLRLKGDYLAIASLGFSEIIRILIINMQPVTNGAIGISQIPTLVSLWWAFGVLAVIAVFMLVLMKTSYGRALKAIREDEVAAEAMGIGLFKHKMIAFVISGFVAGVGGGLLASVVGAVSPEQFKFTFAYTLLLMVVLGGQGSVSGSIIGAFAVTIAQEALRFIDEPINFGFFQYSGISGMRMVVFSLLLMIIILFWSRGIFGNKEFGWDRLFKPVKEFATRISSRKARKGGAEK